MNEYPKFIPGREKAIGSVQFRKMDSEVKYIVIPQPFRDRVVTYTPAPDYITVKVDFLRSKEAGSRVADIRDLPLRETESSLTEEESEAKMHSLAAFLISNKIIPFLPHDILLPLKYPKLVFEETEQPDPTDPRTHLLDYFPSGMVSKRKSR